MFMSINICDHVKQCLEFDEFFETIRCLNQAGVGNGADFDIVLGPG